MEEPTITKIITSGYLFIYLFITYVAMELSVNCNLDLVYQAVNVLQIRM